MAVFEYVGSNRSCVSISVRDTQASCNGADASHSPIIESNESGFILSRLGGRRSRRPRSLRVSVPSGRTRAARERVVELLRGLIDRRDATATHPKRNG